MILIQRAADLAACITQFKQSGLRIGFVPTMGALHDGHLSLIHEARKYTDVVVCSIFVNPTQFNQASDLDNYPRTLGNDIRLLEKSGCTLLFHPSIDEVYRGDKTLLSAADLGQFTALLEGSMRPGHFDGVVTVVSKLFHLVRPDEVFFGQKDYQQCLVVQALIKRDFTEITFHRCNTARESDGLAMSSRNLRLSASERKQAPVIYKALNFVREQWAVETWQHALQEARAMLEQESLKVEYLVACDPETLEELQQFTPSAVLLTAAWLGETRLIDNLIT